MEDTTVSVTKQLHYKADVTEEECIRICCNDFSSECTSVVYIGRSQRCYVLADATNPQYLNTGIYVELDCRAQCPA